MIIYNREKKIINSFIYNHVLFLNNTWEHTKSVKNWIKFKMSELMLNVDDDVTIPKKKKK